MIAAQLSVSFPRGVKANSKDDLGLQEDPTGKEIGPPVTVPEEGAEAASRPVVRGIGTHFISQEAKETADRLTKEEKRIRKAFCHRFAFSPIPGIYIVPDLDAARRVLRDLQIDPDVKAGIRYFNLNTAEPMAPDDVIEWTERVQKQFTEAPLGREKEPSAAGLEVIENLLSCPILAPSSVAALRAILTSAKNAEIDRAECKRRISKVEIVLDAGPVVAPRRSLEPVV